MKRLDALIATQKTELILRTIHEKMRLDHQKGPTKLDPNCSFS